MPANKNPKCNEAIKLIVINHNGRSKFMCLACHFKIPIDKMLEKNER